MLKTLQIFRRLFCISETSQKQNKQKQWFWVFCIQQSWTRPLYLHTVAIDARGEKQKALMTNIFVALLPVSSVVYEL